MAVKHPPILWAQRSSNLYLAVELQEMKLEELKVHEDSFKIKGTKGDEQYEADLQLYGKLKGEERRQVATDHRIELVIPKETAEWWPHLLKEKTKLSWIKVDFDKWKDEDEENAEVDEGFGKNFGAGGMDSSQFGDGGAGGLNFDDMKDSEPEHDEDEDTDEVDGTKTEKNMVSPISASLLEDPGLYENLKPILKAMMWSSCDDMILACAPPVIDTKKYVRDSFLEYLHLLMMDSSLPDDIIAKISILVAFFKDELLVMKRGDILSSDDRAAYTKRFEDNRTPLQRFQEAARCLRNNWNEVYEVRLVNEGRLHYYHESVGCVIYLCDCPEVMPVEINLIQKLVEEALKQGESDGNGTDFSQFGGGGADDPNFDEMKDFEAQSNEDEDTGHSEDAEKPGPAKTDELLEKPTDDAGPSKDASKEA